jgi:hypothetical protein
MGQKNIRPGERCGGITTSTANLLGKGNHVKRIPYMNDMGDGWHVQSDSEESGGRDSTDLSRSKLS